MTLEPTLVHVSPSTVIAAVGTVVDHSGIPSLIPELLEQVWSHIRGHHIDAGHNVVMYRDGGNELTGGVQVPDDTVAPPAPLILARTPEGRAAHLRHVGPYHRIPESIQALFGWCSAQALELAEPSWEVYGDWDEDESKLVTDIYVTVTSN